MSHLTITKYYRLNIAAKKFRQLPYQICHIWHFTTTDMILQKNSGNFPIKFVPFLNTMHYRLNIAKDFGQLPYQICPIWHHYYRPDILQKISGNFPIKYVPFDILYVLQKWYCKKIPATSLSNLSHLTISLYYRLNIAKDIRQHPYQICPIWYIILSRLKVTWDLRLQ